MGFFLAMHAGTVKIVLCCSGLLSVRSLLCFAVIYVNNLAWEERWLLYYCCVLIVMSLLSFFDSSSPCHGFVCGMRHFVAISTSLTFSVHKYINALTCF